MNYKELHLDINKTYGELKFFGLVRENFAYDTINQRKTSELESRTYKVLSMERGEELEVTVPFMKHYDEIKLGKLSSIELVNNALTIKGTPIKKGNFNAVELKGVLLADNIMPVGTAKPISK